MSDLHRIALKVNGCEITAEIEARINLADFLRKDLRLTGTHVGCEHGVCGACTVLVDGASVRACLMLAVQADGRAVETIESLADGADLHPIQAALARHHGLQCGYCTPGVAMTIKELVADAEGRRLTDAEIRAALSGNLCRCTGYQGMVAAAKDVLEASAAGPVSSGP
jgi:carbon-monoxide dehydrogenase small subunit